MQVIKPDGSPAATGEEGQLYFRSQMGTDFEYHKDPEKTEEAHLEPGVFSVGDIGYMDEEGYLYMSDRKIDMIISGGVNIYPAEIEGILVGHPAIADAAVFGIPNEEFGEEVKAAVELSDGRQPSPRTWRKRLRDALPRTSRRIQGSREPYRLRRHTSTPPNREIV